MIATLEQSADLHGQSPDLRPLDWRLLTVNQLLAEAGEELPSHDDPWVNDLAQLCYLGRLKDKSLVLTARHRAIRNALRLKDKVSLITEVLEARLLAGLPSSWIATHSNIPLDTIAAYTALFFDVGLPNPTHRWFQGFLANLNTSNRTIWELGVYLKNTGILLGAVVMEHAICLLSNLNGPTLADGLATPGTPAFAIDVMTRGSIATCLLRSPRQQQRLQTCLMQFRQACDNKTEPEVTDLFELFGKVKITKSLKAQFQQLRCHRPVTSDRASAATTSSKQGS